MQSRFAMAHADISGSRPAQSAVVKSMLSFRKVIDMGRQQAYKIASSARMGKGASYFSLK